MIIAGFTLCFIGLGYVFYNDYSRRKTNRLLTKQTIIYLVSFVNLVHWVQTNFKAELIKVISEDIDLLEFFEKSGTSTKVFFEKIDSPATRMYNLLCHKVDVVLSDIKKPLDSEINAILDQEVKSND